MKQKYCDASGSVPEAGNRADGKLIHIRRKTVCRTVPHTVFKTAELNVKALNSSCAELFPEISGYVMLYPCVS